MPTLPPFTIGVETFVKCSYTPPTFLKNIYHNPTYVYMTHNYHY